MNTKRSKLYIGMLLIMTTISMQDLYAQAIEINGFYGWQLAGTVKLYDGEFMLESAPKEVSGTKWQFAFSLGAGFKIWLSDNIGLRAQGSMMMPMVYNGAGFGCGIGTGGSGCGANVYTRITPFQGEFSGGIILRINPN